MKRKVSVSNIVESIMGVYVLASYFVPYYIFKCLVFNEMGTWLRITLSMLSAVGVSFCLILLLIGLAVLASKLVEKYKARR